MISFKETFTEQVIIHKIIEPITISKNEIIYANKNENVIIKDIFCKTFEKILITNEFSHNVDKNLNVLYKLSEELFDDDKFYDASIKVVKHLVNSSKHPNIKEGDLVIIKFSDVKFNDTFYEAIGIYKIEERENFIITENDKSVKLKFLNGISNKVINKAGLIINTDNDFTVLIFNNKDAEYWTENFFNVKSKNDNINHTNSFLKLTKNFITKEIDNEYEINKTDKIDLLNRTIDYFKKNTKFVEKEFVEKVFVDNDVINSFNNYKTNINDEIPITNSEFEIAPQIVKKQSRTFKSVLKLDKNFHIYIHGNRDLIEKGVDENGRKYYKIYFENEK